MGSILLLTDELPDCNDFEVTEYLAQEMIVEQINNQIAEWCSDNHIEDTFYQFFDLFMKECNLIKSNFNDINRIIQGEQLPNDDETCKQKIETASDFDSSTSTQGFSIEQTIIIVATAPLWIPLIIGATIVGIPVAIGSMIKDAIVANRKIKKYRKNKMEHVLKLAEEKINEFNTDKVYSAVSVAYLQKFMSSLEEVCEQIIPKQIEADKELIQSIMNEQRDYQTLKLEFSPIEQKCKEIVGNLLYVKIKYFFDCQPRILNSIPGRGGFGHVYYCDVDISGNEVQCAVRRLASPIQSAPYLQLSLVDKMM